MAGSYSPPFREPYTARMAWRRGVWINVQCLSASCAHQTQIPPRALIDRGAGDVHLDYAARRMRCMRCRHLGAKVGLVL